jgi:hypothetical protein
MYCMWLDLQYFFTIICQRWSLLSLHIPIFACLFSWGNSIFIKGDKGSDIFQYGLLCHICTALAAWLDAIALCLCGALWLLSIKIIVYFRKIIAYLEGLLPILGGDAARASLTVQASAFASACASAASWRSWQGLDRERHPSSWTRTSLRNPPISSASGDLTHLSGSDGRELGDRWAFSSPAVQWEGELAGLPVPAASMSVGGGRGNLSSRAPLDEALPSVGSFHLFFFWNTLLMNIYGHKLTIFPESACGIWAPVLLNFENYISLI